MEAEEALLKLKATFPELAEHVLQEALLNNDNDYKRASESLRARFYSDDAGIPQEQSFWSSLVSIAGTNKDGNRAQGSSEWDMSLEALQDGVTAFGMQLVQGVEAIADTLGSLGDIFYYEEEETRGINGATSPGDEQVVVGGTGRSKLMKKRGTQSRPINVTETPIGHAGVDNDDVDEEGDDWGKED